MSPQGTHIVCRPLGKLYRSSANLFSRPFINHRLCLSQAPLRRMTSLVNDAALRHIRQGLRPVEAAGTGNERDEF